MAYYVSPEGDDSNSARSAEEAVRSLTRAIELIAIDYPDGIQIPQNVHVAPGTYSASFGEDFPIIVPIDVHVMGEGRDVCVLEYASVPVCEDDNGVVLAPIPVAVDLRGTLSGVSIVNTQLAELDEIYRIYAPSDLDVRDWSAIVENVSCNLARVSAANLLSGVVSYRMTVCESRRQDNELLPQIVQCNCLGYELGDPGWEMSYFRLYGGHLKHCAGNVVVFAPSDVEVENCEIHRTEVGKAEPEDIPSRPGTPRFVDNVMGRIETSQTEEPHMWWHGHLLVEADSRWEGNTIRVTWIKITSNAIFVDNPTILTERGYQNFLICRSEDPSADGQPLPEFYRNTFEQPIDSREPIYEEHVREDGEIVETKQMYRHLIRVLDDAAPLFEGNVFRNCVSGYPYCAFVDNPWSAIWIEDDANPDLGWGERGSQGENVFEMQSAYRFYNSDLEIERGNVHHIHVDIGSRSLMLHASNNTWNTGPRISVVSGEVSWDVEPYSVRSGSF